MIYEPPDYRKLYEEEKAKNGNLQMRLGFMAICLRDQFAMAALQGIIANNPKEQPKVYTEKLAAAAYEIADAMLAAREQ